MEKQIHEPKLLGLIAGAGDMPKEVIRFANLAGIEIATAALIGMADPGYEHICDKFISVHLGELEKTVAFFKNLGVSEILFAGKVDKTRLFAKDLVLDPSSQKLFSSLSQRNDDAILGAVARFFIEAGIKVLDSTHLLKMILPERGLMTRVPINEDVLSDIHFGFRMAKAIGDLDIGQTVVVKNGIVLAVEAIEGTDQAILRGGALGQGGAVVVKVSKPKQDLRFDMPTIGPVTINHCIQAGIRAIAIEAGSTILLDSKEVIRLAEENGIDIISL